MGIRIGILGTGAMGDGFVPAFAAHPLVDQVVLCDLDERRLAASAARHGIVRTTTSYDALLDSDVDAIAIFTQHWMHAPQAIRALDAGKDVYSAVPAAADLDETTALVRAVERSGRIYMMGETSAYYPEAILCRERFARGEFGHLVYAEAEYLHDWDHGLYQVWERRCGGPGWRAQAGDPPMHYPTHSIGMVVSVTGAHAVAVSCVGVDDTRREDRDIYRDDNHWGNRCSNQTALFRMSDGSAMRINEMRRIGHPSTERMTLYGTEACFERVSDGFLWTRKDRVERLDASFAPGHPDVARRQARLPASLSRGGEHSGSHAYLVDDFAKACAWRLQPPVNVWQAARYLVPGLIAHRSSQRAGAMLEIPDFGSGPQVDHAAFETPASGPAAVGR
ncbi:MAG TPA: Gfo/Idh/MocA family oxidoreductase [Planctomycetota bacterium]|nr:Gfo/Idh/MocA family oxidoreductase [Planctomycetota bacterium]